MTAPASTSAPATVATPRDAVVIMGAWLALLWIVEAVEQVTRGSLLWLGISPRQLEDLPQIYTAPLVHLDWQHLMGNSVPFFLLGLVIPVSYTHLDVYKRQVHDRGSPEGPSSE